jgi:hypothetical protein
MTRQAAEFFKTAQVSHLTMAAIFVEYDAR